MHRLESVHAAEERGKYTASHHAIHENESLALYDSNDVKIIPVRRETSELRPQGLLTKKGNSRKRDPSDAHDMGTVRKVSSRWSFFVSHATRHVKWLGRYKALNVK